MKRDDLEEAKRVDAWLRRGLDPESETVERLVRRSLRGERPARSRTPRIAVAAAAAAILLATATFLLFPRNEERVGHEPIALRELRVERPTITNATGTVELIYPPPDSEESSGDSVPSTRDSRAIAIFNSNGIVAAIVPAPTTHHFILGGE